MPHYITEDCIACGACAAECEYDAIAEGDPIYVIDEDKCTDCDACTAVCPADAIKVR